MLVSVEHPLVERTILSQPESGLVLWKAHKRVIAEKSAKLRRGRREAGRVTPGSRFRVRVSAGKSAKLKFGRGDSICRVPAIPLDKRPK